MSLYQTILDDDSEVTREQATRIIAQAQAFLKQTDMTHRELARNSRIHASTLTMFLQGMYAGDWKDVAHELDSFLGKLARSHEESGAPSAFVETKVTKEIGVVASLVRKHGGIALVRGDAGTGKTTALKMIAREMPGVYVSVSSAKTRIKGMLDDIGRAMVHYFGEWTASQAYNRVVDTLRGHKLLIVDEVHKLCQNPDCFEVLRDLADQSKVPQIWCGTTDLIRYFNKRMSYGNVPMAQIRRRILVSKDLNEAESLFSATDIRKLTATGAWKLDADAVRYLVEAANLPQQGGIGMVMNLYRLAGEMAEKSAMPVITRNILAKAHGVSGVAMTRGRVEARLAADPTPDSGIVARRAIA